MSTKRNGDMRKAMVLGVLALAGTLASPAFADEFSGVRLALTFNSDKLQGDFNFAPLADTTRINAQRFGYGLSGGWALNRYLAFEGGINSGASFNQSVFPAYAATFSVAPPLTDPVTPDSPAVFNVHNDIKSVQVTAVGSWWINKKFSLYGRAGGMYWKTETSIGVGDPDGPPAVRANAHDTGFAPLVGFGVQTQLDGALVRLEYQYADLGDLTSSFAFSQTDNIHSSLAFSIVWML
jgi:opacity protein-like surface antigen